MLCNGSHLDLLAEFRLSWTAQVTTELDPQIAELLTRWSVRLAVACYLGRVALDMGLVTPWPARSTMRLARWVWTVGCLLYLVHVLCAFAFFHDWSHSLAYAHTAAQTAAVVGIRWGGGLYFNYVFTLFWLADAAAWWAGDVHTHYRRGWYFWTLHVVFAFMVFNATVVFGPPPWRPVAMIVFVTFATAYFLARRARPK